MEERRPSALRVVLGGVAGWVVSALLVVLATAAALMTLGADGVFEPGSFRSTGTFEAVSTALGAFAALAGGVVAQLVGGRMATALLVAVMLLGGTASGVSAWRAQESRTEPPQPRTSSVLSAELLTQAELNSQRSAAYLIGMPLAGAAGAVAGAAAIARLIRPRA
jgi:hypothetical protein